MTLTAHPTAPAPDLRALAAGEPDAWTTVITRYQPLVASRARRHGLTREDTADLMQDTWLRLFQNAGTVRDPERLPGWVATTASREASRTRQRTGREQPDADTAADLPDPDPIDCDDRLDAARRAVALRAAVAQLPDRERRLIEVLLEPDPPSYAEISTRLHMPIGSIGPIRGRALARLRNQLRPVQQETPHRPDGSTATH